MTKLLILSVSVFLSFTAVASPVLTCINPATGAEFNLSVYANQPPYYTLNSVLAGHLQNQGARLVSLSGSGGQIQYGTNVQYSVNGPNGFLSIDPESGGYRLRVVQYQGSATSFFFNRSECKNDRF